MINEWKSPAGILLILLVSMLVFPFRAAAQDGKVTMELKDAPTTGKQDYDVAILKNCGITEEDAKTYYKED